MKLLILQRVEEDLRLKCQQLLYIENFHIKKHVARKSKGVRTIAPEENFPPVRARVRVRWQFFPGAIVLEPKLR